MIVAVVLGVIVGLVAPDVGKALKPLGTAFVNLIKMMISPVIFCTIVLCVGSIANRVLAGLPGFRSLAWTWVVSIRSTEAPQPARRELVVHGLFLC